MDKGVWIEEREKRVRVEVRKMEKYNKGRRRRKEYI